MALTDLQVFNRQTYSAMTEVLKQQVDKFNAASRGTIVLRAGANQGDFDETAFFKKLSGLVRRRNAYGSGAVAEITMEHLLDTSVKVAAGTAPVRLDPGQYDWIQRSQEEAAAAMGQQLAVDALADMLNTAIASTRAALSQVAAVNFDGTAGTMTPSALNSTARLRGDRSQEIVAWICHSKQVHDYYGDNLANAERLFTYGTVNVVADAFGRVFVITDSPSLINTTPAPDEYHVLGLAPNAVVVDQNNDFNSNFETKNGDENIIRTYQAEWSFNVGIQGFSWDKTNGGKSPNDAALALATNWDQYSTDNKDLAGVMLTCQ
jgi:hypothetical protein